MNTSKYTFVQFYKIYFTHFIHFLSLIQSFKRAHHMLENIECANKTKNIKYILRNIFINCGY